MKPHERRSRHTRPLYEEWRDAAACRGAPTYLFFPDRRRDRRAEDEVLREARSFCQRCEVKIYCLLYALEADIPDGIWGGMSEFERHGLGPKRALLVESLRLRIGESGGRPHG